MKSVIEYINKILKSINESFECDVFKKADASHKDEKKMETQKTNENTRLMFTLQYSLERYQAMGNGPKCQEIQRELNALKLGTNNA